MTRLLTLAALAVALACAPAAHAQKYLRKANKQFELGAFAEAIPGLEKLLRKQPGDLDARARLAHALRMTARLEEAAAAYAVLAEAGSENPAHAYGQALTLMELGRYAEAIAPLSRAAQLGHPGAAAAAKRLEYAQANADAEGGWRISNEFANHQRDDYGAVSVGDYVVYASERDGGGGAQLYRTTRDDNAFLRVPQRLHRVLTEQTNDGPVAYAPSGQLVAYTRNNFESGERFLPDAGWELGLLLATANGENDFQAGKPFVHNGPGYSTGFAAFSPAGDRLYFASDRPGGLGGYDLYVSERTASGWGAPTNLGEQVNTPGNEISPSAHGSSLYFSSDYLPGFGGMDVFRADLLGDAVTSVVNLGVGVNSPLDDVGFALTDDGQVGYLTSNRAGGKGGLDLYRAVRNGKALTIAVVDGKTGAPIPNVLLDFSDCGQGNFLTGADGEYSFRAVDALRCRPRVRKSGYNQKEFTVDAANLRADQRLVVQLNPEDKITIYEGKVIHSRTGDALGGVAVAAKQKGGPFESSARTKPDGRYELSLERGGEYVVTYERAGMARIDREVSTYDSDGAGILSTFAMFPDAAATAPSEATAPIASTSVRAGGGSPTTTTTRSRRVTGSVSPGYAVQVAALSQNTTDISEYQTKLGSLGKVYGKRENNVLRVRIGPFAERREAVAKQARARAMGFSDAFVAKESGGAVVGLDRVVREEAPAPRPTRAAPSASTGAAAPTAPQSRPAPTRPAAPAAGDYLIRLATYGNFTNFDANRVAAIGTLTTRKRGDYVVVLVQGFTSKAAADAKLAAARDAGFPDAHVVIEEADGTLRKAR